MVTVSLTLDKASYVKGETITATYTITGADDTAATQVAVPVNGAVVVDGNTLTASGTINVETPGTTHTRVYNAPTAAGLTFVATADPAVWTATA